MNKQELRKHFKAVRKSMSTEEKKLIEQKVYSSFIASEHYNKCEDMLVYVSSDIEIGTRLIMEHILADIERGENKRLLCPRCEKNSNIMYFYRINSLDDLEAGSYGILEPKAYCERIDEFKQPMCVVPALSFDSKGYRLGFGKGFYDRFLADFAGITVGLCCDSCLTDGELPHDEHDIRAGYVLTESGQVLDRFEGIYVRKG